MGTSSISTPLSSSKTCRKSKSLLRYAGFVIPCCRLCSARSQSLHSEVLDPLHVLLALALELPEDYFLKIHSYEKKSEVRTSVLFPLLRSMII